MLWFYVAASSLGRWHYGTEVDGSHCQAGEGKGKGTCTESSLTEMSAVAVDGCSGINNEQRQCSVTVTSVFCGDNGIIKKI